MPSITVPERLAFAVVVDFLAACGFPTERVLEARIMPGHVEVDAIDDGAPRGVGGNRIAHHTMRVPYDSREPQDQRTVEGPRMCDPHQGASPQDMSEPEWIGREVSE